MTWCFIFKLLHQNFYMTSMQQKCWVCIVSLIIQRHPGSIQRDAIQLCTGQRYFGFWLRTSNKMHGGSPKWKILVIFQFITKEDWNIDIISIYLSIYLYIYTQFGPILFFQYYFQKGAGYPSAQRLRPTPHNTDNMFFSIYVVSCFLVGPYSKRWFSNKTLNGTPLYPFE